MTNKKPDWICQNLSHTHSIVDNFFIERLLTEVQAHQTENAELKKRIAKLEGKNDQ